MYEYSFCQAKKFLYYKKDQLTTIQLAEEYNAIFNDCSFQLCEPAILQVLKAGKEYFQKWAASGAKDFILLGPGLHHMGQCHLSSNVAFFNAVQNRGLCDFYFE